MYFEAGWSYVPQEKCAATALRLALAAALEENKTAVSQVI